MPSGIQVHALAHVAGEADRLARPVAFHRFAALRAPAELRGYLAAQRGDSPVAHDAARGPGEQPESAADHAPPPARAPALRLAAGGSSAPFTTRPGSAPGLDTVPRRSPTACRTP